MSRPSDARFQKSHEWARKEGELVVVGVTDFAVDQMNKEIVFLELPAVGRGIGAGESFGVIESVKAASDLYAPVGGEIVDVNDKASESAEIVANDPFGEGWLIKIKPSHPGDWENLLSPEDYQKLTESEESH